MTRSQALRLRGLLMASTNVEVTLRDAGITATTAADRTQVHNALRDAIALALGAKFGYELQIDRLSNCAARSSSGAIHTYGIVGAGDLLVVYRGHHYELEVKTGAAVQSRSQRVRQTAIAKAGGTYAVVRSVPEAVAAIEAARGPAVLPIADEFEHARRELARHGLQIDARQWLTDRGVETLPPETTPPPLPMDRILALQQQIRALTKERDEAVARLELRTP